MVRVFLAQFLFSNNFLKAYFEVQGNTPCICERALQFALESQKEAALTWPEGYFWLLSK